MIRFCRPRASFRLFAVASTLPLFGSIALLSAAPLQQATVTKIENRVAYGDVSKGRSSARPAAVSDVLRERNFLLTETDSRAELRYEDGSIVRVGQNAVFSFDSDSRTLTLEKGTLLFHIPKGSGGGAIKTPSLTAAITGTSGKVSANIIAIVEGEVRLEPSGQIVHAGEFARRNPDGTITIAKFDPASVMEGKLVSFNGTLPGFEERLLAAPTLADFPQIEALNAEETLYRTQNLPGSIRKFFPEPKREQKEEEAPPTATPTPTPRPVVATTPRPRVLPSPTFNPVQAAGSAAVGGATVTSGAGALRYGSFTVSAQNP